MLDSYLEKLAAQSEPFFGQILRGLEKENLRVDRFGAIAISPHPAALGKALTHPSITTDFAESLPEIITQPMLGVGPLLQNLGDLTAYLSHHLNNSEMLWPSSMPPAVDCESDIIIADYGMSHNGRLKRLYRQGLTHRYGKMMQVIAGLHYNFSFPPELLTFLDSDKTASEWYFILLRNYYRSYWLLPYLFGATPMCDRSLLGDREVSTGFEQWDERTLLAPYSTSLRMSDIGYQNQAQDQICISTEDAKKYSLSLLEAMKTPYSDFEQIGVKVDGQYRQINANLLQIENEYYSPIRPKQIAEGLERPTQALCRRGVQYIEVRVLDLNPFNPIGIDRSESGFMDVFLTHCLLDSAAHLSDDERIQSKVNFKSTVCHGRDPRLAIQHAGQKVAFAERCESLFAEYRAVAKVMDQSIDLPYFASAVEKQWQKVEDVALTPSQQVVDVMEAEGLSHQEFGLKMAKIQHDDWEDVSLDKVFVAEMEEQTVQSRSDEQASVANSLGDFDEFLTEFNKI